MEIFAVILTASALPFALIGLALRRGKTDLIAAHHLAAVPEEKRGAYGRAIARALFVLSGSLAAGGIAAFCGLRLAVGIPIAGIAAVCGMIAHAQIKYGSRHS